MPQDERGIVVDEIEALVAIGVIDSATTTMIEVERVGLHIERRARVAARQRAGGTLEQGLRARRRFLVALLDRQGLEGRRAHMLLTVMRTRLSTRLAAAQRPAPPSA